MNKIIEIIKKNLVFLKYIFSSGISFVLDLSLFTLFNFLLKDRIGSNSIFISTILARIISSLVNYLLNRNKVFKNNDKLADLTSLIKYYLLVIVQMIVSATVVSYLYKAFKVFELLIKIPVEILLFLINYFVQKNFIFNDKSDNRKKISFSKYHNIISFILGILTSFSLFYQVSEKHKIPRSNTGMLSYFAVGILLFLFYKKYLGKIKNKVPFNIISVVFSLLMVFGYSYDIQHNALLVFGSVRLVCYSIFKFIGLFFLFNTGIHLLDEFINNKRLKDKKLPKIFNLFDKHPFWFSFIVILICYLPYIIAFYPVIINYDAANQVKEIMGLHTRYMDSVVLLNPNMTITNFNPIIHTFLIGGLFKIGHLLGNVNFGMFLYSIIQLSIVISTFSYSIYYLHKIKVNKILMIIVLAIFALVPLFPFYAMTAVKDVIFSSLILLFVIKIYDIIKYKQNTLKYILFALLCLLIALFRNNGIYTIILSLFVLLFLKRESRRPVILVLIFSITMYIGYNKVLLPHFEIANTSIREVLSVPFQQTARHVKYYEKDLTEEDKEIIDKVLDYSDLAERYETDLSDKVKNKFNKNTTNEELRNYFGVWFKYLLKRPGVYIDATINNIYGYFYPNTSDWYIYYKLNPELPKAGFDYHYNNLNELRNILVSYGRIFPYIPIIGMIANIGMIVWCYMLIVAMLIVNKMKKHILVLLPSITLILVCAVGPANTYFRYILPCVFALPVIVCILYNDLTNSKKI